MNILVCISKAPDTTSKIAFTNNSTQFDENGVQYIVNPYDELYALVRACSFVHTKSYRLRKQGLQNSLVTNAGQSSL